MPASPNGPALPAGLELPHLVLPGSFQMALDAALLRWAAAAPGRLAARTYAWARPTLSLGRGEPYPAGWNEAAIRTAGIDVVRRPTGGDAVLHDEEVTFAVAASVPGPWAAGPRAFATTVAEALAAALATLGLDAAVVGRSEAELRDPARHPCFARAADGEVRVGRFKAAGIASRFTRGAALSHASVPLTPRHRDVAVLRTDAGEAARALLAHARSVGEALRRPVAPEEVRAPLFEALARGFGVVWREGRWPEEAERCLAAVPREAAGAGR